MNIKPTKKKVIWTPVIALTINIIVPLINWLITTITWPLVMKYIESNQVEGLFQPALVTSLVTYFISPLNIGIFVVEIIVIYFVWSLFQRKKPKMPKTPKRK